jgi:5-aminolevulinate synthase
MVLLEQELADLHGKPATLVFTSDYAGNSTVISTLASLLPGCVIYSDALSHASMIEGGRFSRAQKNIFRHNDPEHLATPLREADPGTPKLVIFESVCSMNGDMSPTAELCDVADRYGAMTYLEEVHAVCLYGPHDGGIAEQYGLMNRVI